MIKSCNARCYQIPRKVKRIVADTLFPKEPQLSQKKCWHHYCASHSTTMDCIKMQDAVRRGEGEACTSTQLITSSIYQVQGDFIKVLKTTLVGEQLGISYTWEIDRDLAFLLVSRRTTDQIQTWLLVKFQKCFIFFISGLAPTHWLFPWQSQSMCLVSRLQDESFYQQVELKGEC